MTRPARRDTWAARPRAAAARVVAAARRVRRAGTGATTGLVAAALLLPAAAAGTPAPPVPAGPPGAPVPPEVVVGQEAPAEGIRIVLDEVDPVVPRAGEPLELRGRVVNDGDSRRRLTSLTASTTWQPLGSREAVTDWVEATDPSLVAGHVIGDDTIGPVLAPGRELPFTVRVPEGSLAGLVADRGVVGLQLRADDAGAEGVPEGVEPVGLRTVLTVSAAENPPEVPLGLSWVVPLTLPPDPGLVSPDPEVRNPAWYAVAGPGSPARTWLDGLDLPGVTWMVDPALLRMLSPAETLTGPGEGVPGEGPEAPEESERPDESEDPQESDGPEDPEGPVDDGATATAVPAPAPTADLGAPSPEEDGGQAGPTDGAPTTAAPAPAPAPEEEPASDDDAGEDGAGEDEVDGLDTDDVETALVELRGRLARVDGPRLWWLPTDDPDLSALVDLEVDGETAHRLLTRRPVDPPAQLVRLLRRGSSTVAWPAAPSLRTDQVATVADWFDRREDPEDGPGSGSVLDRTDEDRVLEAVVVPRESVTGSTGAPVGPSAVPLADVPGVTALGSDSGLTGLVADAGADAALVGRAAVTQRLLADTLTAHQEAPWEARSLLLAPPRGTTLPADLLEQLSEGLASAPWLAPVPAADLLARADRVAPATLTGQAPDGTVLGSLTAYLDPPPSPLDPGRVASLGRIEGELDGLAEVLADTEALRSWQPVLPGLWSTRWRDAPEAWSRTWRALRDLSAQTRSQVHANPSTINFLSDQGLMQVTVLNDLPVAVHDVQARLAPDRAVLRIVDQPGPVSIGAGSRATVSFSARAVTRGQTQVTAELTTPNGTVLGDDAVVDVRVQPTGTWIYWVLGGLAGVLLVLGVVRALRRPGPDGTAPTSTTSAGTTSASAPSTSGTSTTPSPTPKEQRP
ncbi:DUF6049 family protein [uncultured Ornithinimicrobium sp.]|uniref:DUF6049 family protein n=1 Tax=uncultured Ornithinimicrobium sp. TaxID=259307 RepID=UPI0025924AE0|nr:DUF6049 family protein [uncultured Ornithinimicrobium sp.]